MGLLVKVGADLSDFNRKLKRASKDVTYFGGQITSAGMGLTRGVTLPLIGIAVAAGKVGMDFEAQMNRVRAISGAAGEDFQALEDKARALGAATMYTATEAAEGLENFARAGFSVSESLSAIEPSVNLAIATGSDLAVVTDIVASSIRGFGWDARETAKMTDLLASTAANSNTNLEALGEAFSYVAPMAAAMGYTAEDTAEALGLMANAGIKGSMAGTTLRTALTNLANPTAGARKAMEKLGLEVVDAQGNMLPMGVVVTQLRSSFKDLSEEEQAQAAATIFGKRAMSGMLAVINASDDSIDKLSDATTNYNGVVKKQADIMQSGAKGGLMRLKSAVEELAIKLSEVLLPIFNKLTAKVQGFVDKLNSLTPVQMETIVKVLGLVAALGPLLVIVGKGVTIFGKLSAMFQTISGGISLFSGLMTGAALPVIGIVLAIAALIAGFIYLFKTNEQFRDKVLAIWDQVKGMFSAAFEFIMALINVFVQLFSAIWENNFMNIQGIVSSGWEYISTAFSTAIQWITDIFKIFTYLLQGDWSGALEALKTFGLHFWEGIKNIFTAGINLILNIFGTNLDELVAKVKEKIDAIKQTFEDLKAKIKAIIDKVTEIWRGFKLPTFTLKMAVKTFLGKTITYPTGFSINWHAEGGIFTRPTVLGGQGFGEAGKEAILPLSKLPGLLGLNGDRRMTVQVILDGDVIYEYIDRKLGKRLAGGY